MQRKQSWCISTDPEFGPKPAEVAGRYLNPAENAVLLFVDKKPHIQVLERAQGWRRWPSGKALSGFSLGHRNLFTATAGSSLERAEFEMIITDPAMAFYLELEEFREVRRLAPHYRGRMRWKVVRMVKLARIRERLQPSEDRHRTGLRDGLESGGF